jgi:superoxide dismutase
MDLAEPVGPADEDVIEDAIQDLVMDLLVYDRQEDEELPRGAIEAAIEADFVSVDEMVEMFRVALTTGLRVGA